MIVLPNLEEKIALITGGAKGIGKKIAFKLAEAGAIPIVIDLRGAEEVEKELKEVSSRSMGVYGNISDPTSLKKVKETIIKVYGTLDILVNNAGIVNVGDFSSISTDEIKELFETNVYGTIHASKIFGEIMTQRRRGKIINIVSTDAHVGTTGHTSELGVEGVVVYASTKGALLSFTKALAVEWGKYNINVNGISPILVQTPMTQHLFEDVNRLKMYKRGLPLERNPAMEDVANAVLYLSSSLADSVTGHILNVDCGYLANSMRD